MSEPQSQRMTPDEFFEWQKGQERNYELVNGLPYLPLKAMTGATLRHDRVTTNAIATFVTQLRGSPCRPTTDDIAVRIPQGNIRRPDLTVDCGLIKDGAMEARNRALFSKCCRRRQQASTGFANSTNTSHIRPCNSYSSQTRACLPWPSGVEVELAGPSRTIPAWRRRSRCRRSVQRCDWLTSMTGWNSRRPELTLGGRARAAGRLRSCEIPP